MAVVAWAVGRREHIVGRKWEDEAAAGSPGPADGRHERMSTTAVRPSDSWGAGSETWIRTLAGEWSERWNRSHQSVGATRSDETLAR